MIKNQNGSILVVTLGFIFVFTLLGFGSLHYAYMQNELVEKEKASAEAFWLADGALQMAYNRLANNLLDLVNKGDYAPNAGDLKQYDVFSEGDSCPPPEDVVCSDAARAQDPELPSCSDAERSMDPILCDFSERLKDPALCNAADRLPDLSVCTAADRLLDPDGLDRCPCEINFSCPYCPCHFDDPPCIGRCPCEYATEDPCLGRCPCELTDPPSCPCHQNDPDTCPENMIGRCPCEISGSCCVSWNVQAYGEVYYGCTDATELSCMLESRAIKAKVSYDYGDNDIDNAIETWGDVNKDMDCVPDGNSAIEGGCEQQSDFTFETVFNKPQEWFFDQDNVANMYENPNNNFNDATDIYHNPNDSFTNLDPSDPDYTLPVQGITVIKLTGNNGSLNITEDKLEDANDDGILDAALLIIDTTASDKKNIMITVGGNGIFRGIVWIIGEGQLVGTSTILGAVFVAGDDGAYTKVSGTTDVYWDPFAIREALDAFDGIMGNENWADGLKFVNWEEIDAVPGDYE